MREGSDVGDGTESDWGSEAFERSRTPEDRAVATIATEDDTVTFAERDGLEREGATTAWISMDAEHVVDVEERL